MPDNVNSQPDPLLTPQDLRMLADGELSAADQARVMDTMRVVVGGEASVGRQLQIEKNLRDAVARSMRGDVAPAALRTRIGQVLAEANVDSNAEEPVIGRIDREGASVVRDRRSWLFRAFASPQRASIAAMAAVLALIAGAVLFGIYGRAIDDVPVQRGVDVVGNVAQYIDKEHGECTTSLEHIQQQSSFHTISEAEVGLTEALGAPVQAFDLSELGYDFVGAGRCEVPLDEQPSGHLMYRKTVNGKPGAMVSVFIAPVRGSCKGICSGMKAGDWAAAKASCKRRVLYSTDGKLVYFLVCCDDRDLPAVGRTITLAQSSRVR